MLQSMKSLEVMWVERISVNMERTAQSAEIEWKMIPAQDEASAIDFAMTDSTQSFPLAPEILGSTLF